PVWGAVPTPVARKAISAIGRPPAGGFSGGGMPIPQVNTPAGGFSGGGMPIPQGNVPCNPL
ncbi:MAG: hypothetical protein RR824_04835, partial [Clostridia bacterium]